MLNRRSFTGLLSAIAAISVISGMAQAQGVPVAKNVVLVHGLSLVSHPKEIADLILLAAGRKKSP